MKRKTNNKHTTSESVFVIKEKSTGLFWQAGSKIGWISSGAAKNAWNLHAGFGGSYCLNYKDKITFDTQNEYELVEIKYDEVN